MASTATTSLTNLPSLGSFAIVNTAVSPLVLSGATLSISQASIVHNNLGGLTTGDPHTQYALLDGRSGGQILTGGTGATDFLNLKGTTNTGVSSGNTGVKVTVGADGSTEAITVKHNGNVGIGRTSPSVKLDVNGGIEASSVQATSITAIAGFNGNLTGNVLGDVQADYITSVTTETDFLNVFDTTNINNLNVTGQANFGSGGSIADETMLVYKNTNTSANSINFLSRHNKTVAGGFNFGIKNEFDVNVTTGSTDSVQAFSNYVSNSNLGTITFVEAFTQGVDNLGTGTITNLSQIKVFTPTNNGTIGTLRGIYIENQTGATTNYSIYSDGGTMYHYDEIIIGAGYLDVNGDNNVAPIALGDGDILAGSSTSSFQYDSAGNLYFDRYTDTPTTTPQMFFRKARGTASSKTAITAGDDIGYIRGQSFDGTTFDEVTRIQFETSAAQNSGVISFHTSNAGAAIGQRVTIREDGDVGIGIAAPLAKLHIDQASTTAAIGVMTLDQADASEEYFDFITPALTAGNPVNTSALGTYYGRARVRVNGTEKWIAIYNT